ncbi:MAG TPA: DUF4157 domain-containing protein [Pyrinomonadaceae bacterium]|nr:DUF4157 domain-containing protein [Pyrinomonadaceae bacterium]
MPVTANATRSTDNSPAPAPTPAPAPAPAPTRSSSWMQSAPPAVSLKSPGSSWTPSVSTSSSSGAPLPSATQHVLESSFQTNFDSVRVHTDSQGQDLTRGLSTRAVTYGNHIFLGSGERPSDLRVMAHEAAHVVQQRGAPSLQQFSTGGDTYEAEAEQASAAVMRGEQFAVREQTGGARMQGLLGISIPDPLDWLAGKANIIPGFRMFTIVLGVNPINMTPVDRNAANVLRAMIEIMPGGGLVTQALDSSGVFEKAGAFVEKQIATLGLVGSSIKASVTAFIKGLSLPRDLLSPGATWERAKRIFTDPIDRIKNFAKGLVAGIVQLVKDAILKPIAKLAEGTEGYNLLKGILGKDPITGESVTSSAETLLGPLMKMIGLGDVWAKMQQAKAIPRAWAWFQTTKAQLIGFVSQIPGLFIAAFKALTLEDIILIPKAFAKLANVFGGFIGKFVGWGVDAMWKLLEIVFDVVSPGAFGYVKQTGAALKSILKNPLPFVGNLVKAGKLGFTNFAGRFLTHLKNGLLDWLTGSLPGVYVPKAFSLLEFGKMALSILGLSWAQIRAKIVKALGPNGEMIMKGLEETFNVVRALISGGPAAAWEVIKDKLTSLKDTIVNGIIEFVVEAIVTKAIPKLIAMFIPGAGFISAIISIYDTIMVFVNKIAKIIQVVNAFINSIVAIAAGNIGAAAGKVESILGGLLSLAINFLAGFAGLGKIANKVMGVINKVRGTVDKALDAGVNFIVSKAKALFGKLFAKNAKDGDPEKEKLVKAGLVALDAASQAQIKNGVLAKADAEKVAASIKQKHPVFKALSVVETKDRFDYDYVASPGRIRTGGPRGTVGPLGITRKSLSFTADTKAYLLTKFKSAFPPGQLGQWKDAKLDIRHKVSISDTIKHLDAAISPLTFAEAAKVIEGKGCKPASVDKAGIVAACREHLQKANNDTANLFVGAAGTNRRKKQAYDPGDAPSASPTAAKHDPQKGAFIGTYGFEGTDFVVTVELTVDGVKTETWQVTP